MVTVKWASELMVIQKYGPLLLKQVIFLTKEMNNFEYVVGIDHDF